MPDTYKILYQVSTTGPFFPFDGEYEVPSPAITTVGPGGSEVEVSPKATSIITQVKVTSIVACNTTNTDNDIYIFLAAFSGATSADQSYLVSAHDLDGYATKIFDFGMVLTPGNIVFLGSDAETDWTINGIETTSGVGPNA
jgi:hypothetical protein